MPLNIKHHKGYKGMFCCYNKMDVENVAQHDVNKDIVDKEELRKEKARARSKKYYAKNKDKVKAYYEENKDETLQYQREKREAKSFNSKFIIVKITNEQLIELRDILDDKYHIMIDDRANYDIKEILEQFRIK